MMHTLVPGISAVENAVWLPSHDALIISDVHLGLEEALADQGILLPKTQLNELKQEYNAILAEVNPKLLIINGDLKHEFGRISRQEWQDARHFLQFIKGVDVVLVKGNHDTMLKPIANKLNLELRDYILLGDIFICHGDRIFHNQDFAKAKSIIIGHVHPAVELDDTIRREKYKCFLVGKYKRKRLVVMPSFNPLFEGSAVVSSPFVTGKVKRYVFAQGKKHIF